MLDVQHTIFEWSQCEDTSFLLLTKKFLRLQKQRTDLKLKSNVSLKGFNKCKKRGKYRVSKKLLYMFLNKEQ